MVKKKTKDEKKKDESPKFERHTAVTNKTFIYCGSDKEHVSAVQEFLVKREGKERFIEIVRVFFDYNTVFMKCMGPDFYRDKVEVVYHGENGPKLKLQFGVELDTYEHALIAGDFIIEEYIRFKVNSFIEITYDENGAEKIVAHDELRKMYNNGCEVSEEIKKSRYKTNRTMKPRKEREKNASKHN